MKNLLDKLLFLILFCVLALIQIEPQYFPKVSISHTQAYTIVTVALITFSLAMHAFKEQKHLKTQLSETYERLKFTAQTDPITEIANRRAMQGLLDSEMSRFERNDKIFSIVLFDIDYFKVMNENYGYECGDFVLSELSCLITQKIRKQDTIARWSGEQFLLLLPDTNREGATLLANKLRKSIAQYNFLFENEDRTLNIKTTVTMGTREYCDKSEDNQELFKRAEENLAEGKDKGRNCVI